MHCQIRWFTQGEALSRIFFAQLQAHQARDTLQDIQFSNGSHAIIDLHKKQTFSHYYANLYTTNPQVQTNVLDGSCILSLLPIRISKANNNIITTKPILQEIIQVVFVFQLNNSLGLDGGTTKMLRAYWEFIQFGCFAMILPFGKNTSYHPL